MIVWRCSEQAYGCMGGLLGWRGRRGVRRGLRVGVKGGSRQGGEWSGGILVSWCFGEWRVYGSGVRERAWRRVSEWVEVWYHVGCVGKGGERWYLSVVGKSVGRINVIS